MQDQREDTAIKNSNSYCLSGAAFGATGAFKRIFASLFMTLGTVIWSLAGLISLYMLVQIQPQHPQKHPLTNQTRCDIIETTKSERFSNNKK